MILFEKFGQHQPLNRQSKTYAREGIEIDVSTLADRVGAFHTVNYHRRGLPAGEVGPVKHRPDLLFHCRPFGGHAVQQAGHVVVVRRSIGDDLDIADFRKDRTTAEACRGEND